MKAIVHQQKYPARTHTSPVVFPCFWNISTFDDLFGVSESNFKGRKVRLMRQLCFEKQTQYAPFGYFIVDLVSQCFIGILQETNVVVILDGNLKHVAHA